MTTHALPAPGTALPLKRRGAPARWLAAATLALAATAQAQVGLTQIDLAGLPVTLTYPTEARATPQPFGPFTLDVARDAEPAPGPRRALVLISHGTGGSAVADHALAAALVRAGLVVAQPLHAGDNHTDTSKAGPASWRQRPGEISRVIDALAAHPQWRARLRFDRVGVHGMSAGGVTALALAGAQWRMLDLVRHCNAHFDADIGFCLNGATTAERQADRRAGFERARGVPEAFLPADMKALHGGRTPGAGPATDPRPDPRIAAVTLAVPVAAIFTPESLARIGVPVGVVSASADTMLLPDYHAAHVLRHCGRCALLADLAGAGHFDVLEPWPESVAREVAAQQVRGGSPQPGFDARQRSAAHAAIADMHRRELLAPVN